MSQINCSCIGEMGRFGNQMFQYIFAQHYANQRNSTLHTPEWDGEKIFNLSCQRIDRELKRTEKDSIPAHEDNIDLYGYFQKEDHVRCWWETIDPHNLFKFKDEIINNWKEPIDEPYVAIHLRRGDYNYLPNFPVIDYSFYEQYLRAIKCDLPIVIVTDENPHKNEYYEKEIGLDWLNDFMILRNARVLLTANSSFSYWAGFLSVYNTVYTPVCVNANEYSFSKGFNVKDIQCRQPQLF